MDFKQQQENTKEVLELNNINNRNKKLLQKLESADYFKKYVRNALEVLSKQEESCSEHAILSKKFLNHSGLFSYEPFSFTPISNTITVYYYNTSLDFSFSDELMEKLHTYMSDTTKGIRFKDKPTSTKKDTETLLKKELADLVYEMLNSFKEND